MASELDTLRTLIWSLDVQQPRLRRYDAYYEGEQPIRFVAPALQREFGDRITPLVLNWGRVIGDGYENRLDIEGFRFKGDDSADEMLWDVWQANNLDEQSQQGHLDSVTLSRAYVIVGSPDAAGDPPVVTVESPLQVFASRDARTRRVNAAVKRWYEPADRGRLIERATLYLPGSTQPWIRSGSAGWQPDGAPDVHDMPVPVVPLVNRPRIMRPDGLSELHDAIVVADAANKIATDMMVSAEFHAMPRRWGAGVKQSDFVDAAGNALNPWSRDAGTMWMASSEAAKFGQFNESDLSNFHATVRLLAQIVCQLAALPPHYMDFGGTNPTSADAIRSSETQLVKRVERKHTYLGGAWEDVQRLVLAFMGVDDSRARSLETLWRDPSTPTVAQRADAVLKLATPISGGKAIIPLRQAREDLGYSAEQIRRMEAMDAEDAMNPQFDAAMAKLTGPAGVVPAG